MQFLWGRKVRPGSSAMAVVEHDASSTAMKAKIAVAPNVGGDGTQGESAEENGEAAQLQAEDMKVAASAAKSVTPEHPEKTAAAEAGSDGDGDDDFMIQCDAPNCHKWYYAVDLDPPLDPTFRGAVRGVALRGLRALPLTLPPRDGGGTGYGSGSASIS